MIALVKAGHRVRTYSFVGIGLSAVIFQGCAPKLSPLRGIAPVNYRLPQYEIVQGSNAVTVKWELTDDDMIVRGEGLVRTASPDSARVDLVINGAFGGGAAVVLIDDKPVFPHGASMTHLLPPTPLLWAALGRSSGISAKDTVMRVSGDTLMADIGTPVQWRLTAIGNSLVKLERVSKGRVVEYAHRKNPKLIEYGTNKRKLTMHIVSIQSVDGFNPGIWTFSE